MMYLFYTAEHIGIYTLFKKKNDVVVNLTKKN